MFGGRMKLFIWLIALVHVGAVVALVMHTRLPDGPDSPTGLTTRIELSDSGFGPGADFYADVVILDSKGSEIVRWKDADGQDSKEAVNIMIESMQWSNEKTLQFRIASGDQVELTAP